MLGFISSDVQLNATKDNVVPTSLRVHGLNWDPSPRPRKRVKLTYSSKEPTHANTSDTPADSSIPSGFGLGPSLRIAANFVNVDPPLLPSNLMRKCQSRTKGINRQLEKSSQLGPNNVSVRSRETFRQFAKSAYPECWQLFDGIHSGLEILLKATSKNLTGNGNGARSLLSTCLRKTSEYIAMQERWCRTEDPETAPDISSSIYAELETIAARSVHGSNALQEVVRAHGVDMICSAVIDGLICFPIASRIVKLCLRLEAYDEAETVVECIFAKKSFPKPTSGDDILFKKELSVLDQFAIVTGRFGFLYRKLTTLFANRLLPIEWISSPDMIERWSGVIRCISEKNSDSRDAGVLLRTVIMMSDGDFSTPVDSQVHCLRIGDTGERRRHITKVDETGSFRWHKFHGMGEETRKSGLRLLAALCALDFAQKLAVGPATGSNPVLQALALEAHQVLETQKLGGQLVEESAFQADGPCLVLLGAALNTADAKDEVGLHGYLDIFERKNLSDAFPSKAASFLSIVASWRGQALASDGFEFIQDVVEQLLRVSALARCLPPTRELTGVIATTAAIHYASSTSKPRHLSWALDIERRVNGMTVGLTCHTPRRIPNHRLAKAQLGFKWEEGICEWVAGTPGVLKPKPIIYRDIDDTVCDPESTGMLKPAVCFDSNPSRVPCLQVVPCASARSNGGVRAKRVVPSYPTKSSHGIFLGVEVGHRTRTSRRASRRALQHHIEPNSRSSSEAGADEMTNHESSPERPICSLEKLRQPNLALNGPVARDRSRGRNHKVLGKHNACGGGSARSSRGVSVKSLMEAAGSEDELNF